MPEVRTHKIVWYIMNWHTIQLINWTINSNKKSHILIKIAIVMKCFDKPDHYIKTITGGPRYSRGLRPKKKPQIPKPRIALDHCFLLFRHFYVFLPLRCKISADNRGKFPRIMDFVHNSQALDSQNREWQTRGYQGPPVFVSLPCLLRTLFSIVLL